MKKLCALLRIKFFSQQDDTKIVNFDYGVLILFYGRFSEAMSFSRFVLYCKRCYFRWINFSRFAAPKRIRRLLNSC